jgi:CheY-like chemotaxis protein
MARILVVDDEAAIRRAIERILTSAGHEVVTADEGALALRKFEEGEFDAILTDLFMPGTDGIELVVTLAGMDVDVPIVAMSGGGRVVVGESVLKDAQALGATATLAKPFSSEDVIEVIERVLGG